jgi:hypothetical protein
MGFGVFELLLEIAQGLELRPFVFADPPFVDFVERHGIQKVELFAPVPDHGEEIGGFEDLEVLGHGLAGHVEMGAEFRQRLPVGLVQLIEELAAA